jgi:hypothetical protein
MFGAPRRSLAVVSYGKMPAFNGRDFEGMAREILRNDSVEGFIAFCLEAAKTDHQATVLLRNLGDILRER